jgi:hypothetical protein
LVTFDRYDVDLRVDMYTLGATYGLSENIDLNVILPILDSRLSVGSVERRYKASNVGADKRCQNPTLQPNGLFLCNTQRSSSILNKAGIGDLLFRGKYRFATNEWGELASGLVLRAPTGSKDDFQGTGAWEVSPLLYASTHRIPIAGPLAVQAFFNGGLDLDIEDVDRSAGRFGAGIDLAFGQRATFSVAFLGREPFHSFPRAGFFDVPRYNRANNTCATRPDGKLIPGTCPRAPLFGLSTARPSYYSLSIGGRVSLWRDTVFGFANVLVPLLDEGIHTDPIPLVGIEATF